MTQPNYLHLIRTPLLLFMIMVACRPSNKIGELVGVPKEKSLENTFWVLDEISEKTVSANNGSKPFIELNAGTKSISGFGGCNKLSGNYQLTGNKIKLTTAATRMFCEQSMEVETHFLQALTSVNGFEIKEHELYLKSDNKIILKFHAETREKN